MSPLEGRQLGRQEIDRLVTERIAAVLSVPTRRVTADARLAADLHADSLDLVEIVESIESSLREQGHQVRVAESQLVGWHTVRDVVDGLLAAIRGS